MKKTLILVAAVVTVTLAAPAAQADDGTTFLPCQWLKRWLGDDLYICAALQSAESALEVVTGNDETPVCLGCGGLPTPPADPSPDPENSLHVVTANDTAPICLACPPPPVCLACGGHPTPPVDPGQS